MAPRSFAYQWMMYGNDIAGASSGSYAPSVPGNYSCSVTATNQAGSSTQNSAAQHVVPPPKLTSVSQSHARWREGNGLPHVASAATPVGTTFRFTLKQSARVRFVFKQHGATRGTLSFSVGAGAHRVRFQGRLPNHKTLPLGRYALIITATNSAGQRTSVRLTFTIVG
jgi:hypothetical protein